MHPLDRPAWASLNGPHAALGQGGALARRYDSAISPFAATADDHPESLAALAALVAPGEAIYVVQADAIVVPPGLVTVKQGRCVQMLCEAAVTAPPTDWQTLGDADAAEMLALAQLTEPGPFGPRTHILGRFLGVRAGVRTDVHEGGMLAAMAGERLRPAGFVEVSGVCTHPQWQGRGLARRLSAAVSAHIQASGAQPFLHAWTSNTAAIALYRSLGFAVRREMNVAVLARPPQG